MIEISQDFVLSDKIFNKLRNVVIDAVSRRKGIASDVTHCPYRDVDHALLSNEQRMRIGAIAIKPIQ